MSWKRTIACSVVGGLVLMPGATAFAAQPNSSNDYVLMYNQKDAHWNSCETIGYKVNLNGVPKRENTRIKTALKKISRVTALRFQYEGTTKSIPLRTIKSTSGGDPTTDITIAFAAPGSKKNQSPRWSQEKGILGRGGPAYTQSNEYYMGGFSDGLLLLNSSGLSKLSGTSRLVLYMHELGHVMGLDHSLGSKQIMTTPIYPTTKPIWGKGDLAGLKKLGFGDRPCLPLAPPDVEDLNLIKDSAGLLKLSWFHDSTGFADPAGASRPATTEYKITLTREWYDRENDEFMEENSTTIVAANPGQSSYEQTFGTLATHGEHVTVSVETVNGVAHEVCEMCSMTRNVFP